MEDPKSLAVLSFKPTKYMVCVSDNSESLVALKLACFKARRCNGQVDMLHVIPPADFQTLSTIAEKMREEQHAEAQEFLQKLAAEAEQLCGVRPSILVKEGQVGDGILHALQEDAEVDMLVLGIGEPGKTRLTLIHWLGNQIGGKVPVPVLLVPGNLTDEQTMALV